MNTNLRSVTAGVATAPAGRGHPPSQRILSAVVTAVSILCVSAGCTSSDDDNNSNDAGTTIVSLECGTGTKEVNGQCVPSSTIVPLICGEGAVEKDGKCVPSHPLVCGEGSEEVDGACVPISTIACGEGTAEVDGKCVSTTTPMECGPGTIPQDGSCVPENTLTCGEGTNEQDGACLPVELEPGQFTSPIVELQKAIGLNSHMHIQEVRYRESDAKLFVCSYELAILDATNPANMRWMAQDIVAETPSGSPRDPGCHRLDWSDEDPDIWFTTHRKNIDFATYLSAWDNNTTCDPAKPNECKLDVKQITPALQEPGVSYEGLDYSNGYIYVAIHSDGLAIYTFDGATFTRIGDISDGLDNSWDVVVHESGEFAVIADGLAGIATVDITDPTAPTVLAHIPIGGQAEVVVLDGNTAYFASGAAGLVIVDVSDPMEPKVLSTTDTPGTAVGIDYHSGKAFVASWNDTWVFDVADPTAPKLIGATRQEIRQPYAGDAGLRPDKTARTLGVAGFGDRMFVGNWWTPYSFHVYPQNKAPYLSLPESYSNVGFGPAEVGATKTATLRASNLGTAPLTIYKVWSPNPAFAVKTPDVRIEPGDYVDLELTYTATKTDKEEGPLYILSDDPQRPKRTAWLVGNQPGLGVDVPMPETTGDLVDGNSWSFTEDALGKVTVLAYFATF
ncbi:MAG: alkyl hydroperoxide reductase [Myxococcales bacterium]|nr:alkyl hydroperoxide reductase [Myxococcales bacterium]